MKKIVFNKKKLKHGALATGLTILFIVAVILINIIASALVDRFNINIDLTTEKSFSVTDTTKDYLKKVNEKVEIEIMTTEESFIAGGAYFKQAVEVMKSYAKLSDNIEVKFIDLLKNPTLASEYENKYNTTITQGNIIVKSDKRIKALTVYDIYEVETDQYYGTSTIVASNAEQAITSAIMYVTDIDPMKITVLTSTKDSDISAFTKLLNKNGYEIEEVDALTGEIDSKSSFVIIPAPSQDYSEETCDKIADFLYNDGELNKNVLYVGSYTQAETPNLDALLAEWGIKVETGVVRESDTNYLTYDSYMNEYLLASINTEENDFAANLAVPNNKVILYGARPLKALFETNGSHGTKSLLASTNSSFVQPADADKNWSKDDATKQSYNLILQGYMETYDSNNEYHKSNVIAVSSDIMLSSTMLSSTSYNNAEYMLGIFNTLTGKTDGITIVSKTIGNNDLTLTEAQIAPLKLIFVFLIPFVVIVAGIVVWVRRRNR